MGEALENKAKADKRFEVVRRSLIVDAMHEVQAHMHVVGRAANK
jgi:hypothetical protein